MVRFLPGLVVVVAFAWLWSAVPVAARDGAPPDPMPSPVWTFVQGVAASAAPGSGPTFAAPEPSLSVASGPVPMLTAGPARRTRSDVPLFAGPAELRVAGESGAYRWASVSFGAQEVEAWVTLVPGGEPCAARVRLISDGRPVLDTTFDSDAKASTALRSVIDVDYVTASLKVDSDCAQWSMWFEPIEDPELKVVIKERFYPVRGDTIAALEEGTHRIEGKWAAFTRWQVSWAYTWLERGASCQVNSAETELAVTVRMPRWKRPKHGDGDVAAEWERVYRNLLEHELGHVTIALQGADAIDDKLDAGPSAKICKRMARQADAKATLIFKRYEQASRRYDKDTRHGRTQGTWFRALEGREP